MTSVNTINYSQLTTALEVKESSPFDDFIQYSLLLLILYRLFVKHTENTRLQRVPLKQASS